MLHKWQTWSLMTVSTLRSKQWDSQCPNSVLISSCKIKTCITSNCWFLHFRPEQTRFSLFYQGYCRPYTVKPKDIISTKMTLSFFFFNTAHSGLNSVVSWSGTDLTVFHVWKHSAFLNRATTVEVGNLNIRICSWYQETGRTRLSHGELELS